MSGDQLFVWVVLGLGIVVLAVQHGIAIGERRREERIERQRGAEIKTLLEWVGHAWRQQR